MRLLPLAALLLLPLSARAVIVRGTVTDPLGRPVPGARVQLIALTPATRSVADALTAADGSYSIRTDLSGRFLLLTSAATLPPQIGRDFYAGRTDLLLRDIMLDPASLTPLASTLSTGLPTPLPELPTPPTQIPADRLLPRALLSDELPLAPASFLLPLGQLAQPTLLFLRGADPASTAVLFDGIPINDLGGAYNFGPLASTGLAAPSSAPSVEILPGPNPLFGLHAEAGLVALDSPRAANIRPELTLAADAGTLRTFRDEAVVALTRRRADLFAAASRFDSANALLADRVHVVTAAANLGYNISAGTALRLTLRNETDAAPLPIPYNLGFSPLTRQSDSNTYGTLTFLTRRPLRRGDLGLLLRYGLVRKRERTFVFRTPPVIPATIHGANGYSLFGTATFPTLPPREDTANLRDVLELQADRPIARHVSALLLLRYQDERGLDAVPTLARHVERSDFTAALALRAELKHRLFAEASGDINSSSLLGLSGSPRLGLTVVPVFPGGQTRRPFHGTAFHLTAATGSRASSLQLEAVARPVFARTRTFDFSADQRILREKLTFHAAYFHNQFSHQVETLAAFTPSQTLAFRTQGLTSELRLQPAPRLLITGGYTYMASLVEQSAATPVLTPAFPGIPIGAFTALPGARPFHRPPHTGFFALAYTGQTLTAALTASLAGRSDGSTAIPTLLLPNRNVDFGYTRLDANLTYALRRNVTMYTQLNNLLNDQHLAPIGYPSAPFTVRLGLRLRLGGD